MATLLQFLYCKRVTFYRAILVENPHPHWPDKAPSSLQELQQYLQNHFDFLFDNSKNLEDIRKVLSMLKSNPQELLTWEDADSFFTLFSPFHTGIPFFAKMQQRYRFPDALLQFLLLCTALEKTTDQFAYIKKVKDLKNTDKIIEDLEALLRIMPTKEQFVSLVQEIRKRT